MGVSCSQASDEASTGGLPRTTYRQESRCFVLKTRAPVLYRDRQLLAAQAIVRGPPVRIAVTWTVPRRPRPADPRLPPAPHSRGHPPRHPRPTQYGGVQAGSPPPSNAYPPPPGPARGLFWRRDPVGTPIRQRVGQIPGSDGSARLQKMIGIACTKDVVMCSRRIPAGNRASATDFGIKLANPCPKVRCGSWRLSQC